MKKLFLLIGILAFAFISPTYPMDNDFDTGIVFEQSDDCVTVVDATAVNVEIDYLVIDNSLKDGAYGFSPGDILDLCQETYFNETNIYLGDRKENYLYLYATLLRQPPTILGKSKMSNSKNFSPVKITNKDIIYIEDKTILYSFWIC
jgi:hypothetical protein